MTSTIGVPIKLLNEAQVRNAVHIDPKDDTQGLIYEQGHVVTVEIASGQTFRGKLLEGARALQPYSA
ncbi:hypothetical protein FH972_024546 [Carpinus fangiana]|uniref:Uncharacterized protein n=1 Tax=Carpinus fangiana TaxID=176857 RepID=A0A5N6KYU7_9ROSI|nr:hypothetical protein FH972_024546 [Carpinus fangiana]